MQTSDISPSVIFASSDPHVLYQQPLTDQQKTVYLALCLQPLSKTDVLPYLPNISKRMKTVKLRRMN